MLTVTVVGAICTAFGFFGIIAKFSPKYLKRFLAYEAWIDLLMSIGVLVLYAGSGVTAMLTGIITGVIFSIALFAMKRCVGYSKRENGKWVDYPATWTLRNIGFGIGRGFRMAATAANDVAGGLKNGIVKEVA